jgi:hypothetical protein
VASRRSKGQYGRDAAATLVIVSAVVGAVVISVRGVGAHAPDRCAPLFDRYVELRLKEMDDSLRPADRAERVAKARTDDRASDALRACATRLTDGEAECAANAATSDDFERCFP